MSFNRANTPDLNADSPSAMVPSPDHFQGTVDDLRECMVNTEKEACTRISYSQRDNMVLEALNQQERDEVLTEFNSIMAQIGNVMRQTLREDDRYRNFTDDQLNNSVIPQVMSDPDTPENKKLLRKVYEKAKWANIVPDDDFKDDSEEAWMGKSAKQLGAFAAVTWMFRRGVPFFDTHNTGIKEWYKPAVAALFITGMPGFDSGFSQKIGTTVLKPTGRLATALLMTPIFLSFKLVGGDLLLHFQHTCPTCK